MVLMFGQAVGATIAEYSEFDRKNYFYPDIPKAYQISQYAFPFLTGGQLCGVDLTRVHLEEDTARSQHDKGDESLVDFNRAGVPLMELVTEPVIHDAKTAGQFAKELQLLLRTLGISDANMERGEMRVEANISVSKSVTEFGTKVEVKNLNSFKSVEGAIEYEINRQIELLENGDKIVQETRGWDENKSKTFTQRQKETAKDYRYFPDPDIPKISVGEYMPFSKTILAEKMPDLPNNKRVNYKNLGLTSDTIETVIADRELDTFMSKVVSSGDVNQSVVRLAGNYLTTDVSALVSTKERVLSELKPDHFVELMQMLSENKISSRVAKDLLPDMFGSGKMPSELAKERNLLQLSDAGSLEPLIKEIIAENQTVVEEYKSGKDVAIKFLIGQAMKKTKGAANPILLEELLVKSIIE